MQPFAKFAVHLLRGALVLVGILHAVFATYVGNTTTGPNSERYDALWREQFETPQWARSLLGVDPQWAGLGWYVGDWVLYLGIIAAVVYLPSLGERFYSSKVVFISYRRDDAGYLVKKLDRALSRVFGQPQVFLDVRSIPAGVDFPSQIRAVLPKGRALVLLMDTRWNVMRLSDPNDFVRLELDLAKTHKVPVIPVLLGFATMPRGDELPDELRWLATTNAQKLGLSDGDSISRAELQPLVRAIRALK